MVDINVILHEIAPSISTRMQMQESEMYQRVLLVLEDIDFEDDN